MLKAQPVKVESQVEQFLDWIAEADNPSVIAAYEARIRELEEQRIVLAESVAKGGRPVRSFEDALRASLDFISSP